MKTRAQIGAEIYNALTGDSSITDIVGTRINWLSRPTVNNTFPMITYQFIDTTGSYALGATFLASEEYEIQITAYCDPGEIDQMDTLTQAIKDTMHTLKWRLVASPGEFEDTEIKKIVQPTRWEDYNV